MKKVFKVFMIVAFLGLAAYAVYLLYDKFIRKSDSEEWDDLEDWGYEFEDEEQPEITFTERIRTAAEKHLKKAR